MCVKKCLLILAGAPLGNSRDLSLRVRDLLGQVDLIAAEDTRRLLRLCSDLDISLSAPVISLRATMSVKVPPVSIPIRIPIALPLRFPLGINYCISRLTLREPER